MPGAFSSTKRVSVVSIGPLPSIGSPSAFTTRPRRASPTGTLKSFPKRLTLIPSFNAFPLPSVTIPAALSSKFITRPRVPSSNSTISPAITLLKP